MLTNQTDLFQYFQQLHNRPNQDENIIADLTCLCYESQLEVLRVSLEYFDGYILTLQCQHSQHPQYEVYVLSRCTSAWQLRIYTPRPAMHLVANIEVANWQEVPTKLNTFVQTYQLTNQPTC